MSRTVVNREGRTYGIFKIVNELGGNEVVARCDVCGKSNVYNKSNLVNGKVARCKDCNSINIQIGREVSGLIIDGINGNGVRLKCKQCGLVNWATPADVVNGNTMCSRCGKVKLYGRTINYKGKLVGELEIVKELGDNKVECKCIKCGAVEIYDRNRVIKGKVKCSICNNEGYYKYNIIGLVYNNLQVIKEEKDANGKIYCTVRCLECGEEFRRQKGRILTRAFKCPCEATRKITVRCPICDKEYSVSRLRNQLVCHMCGSKYNVSSLTMIEDIKKTADWLMKKYGIDSRYIIKNDIIIFKSGYRGYDGRLYWDGHCLKHNKHIIVCADKETEEIQNYNHEMCTLECNN